VVGREVVEGGGERAAGPRQIGGRTRAAEEDRRVVKEAGALLFGAEGQPRQQLPEVVGQPPRRFGVALLAQRFLRAKPVAVRAHRIAGECRPEMAAELVPASDHGTQRYAGRAHPAAGRGAGSAKYVFPWSGLFSWPIRSLSAPPGGSPTKSRGERASAGSSKTSVVV